MPAWIHDRAKRLQAKNPDMAESTAWAVATQQSHALGKSPKGYGTEQGRETAKAKYKTPGDDKKTAGVSMNSITMAAMADEVAKIAMASKDAEMRLAPPTRLARQPSFTPAVVGSAGKVTPPPAKPKPLPPSGALNPGGGML